MDHRRVGDRRHFSPCNGLRGSHCSAGNHCLLELSVSGGWISVARPAFDAITSPIRVGDRSRGRRLTAMDNRVTNVFSIRNRGGLHFDAGQPSDRNGNRASRLVWLFIAFAVPLVAVAARLVQLQCFLADDYIAAFETTTESLEAIPSIDGRIYAGDGRVLAEDVERYNVSVHYRWLEEPPNEHWLTRLALSGLTRAERRNRTVVDARRHEILARRDALWVRLSELSGLSPKVLVEKRVAIQQRVERI